MKTLYTIGDSFTYGDELDDPKHAWPYILGDLMGYRVDNLARNGASNDYIVKSTVEYLESNTPDYGSPHPSQQLHPGSPLYAALCQRTC